MKKKKLILATSIGIFVVIGSLVAVLVLLPGLGTSASSNAAAQGSASSGAIVIAWNQELLHIVQTPKAQPATVHPTRSFAIMHAAIYDAVNAIDRGHRPYLVRLTDVPRHASQDAAAAAAAHDVLVALYPTFSAELDAELQDSLAHLSSRADQAEGVRIGQTAAARLLALRQDGGSS